MKQNLRFGLVLGRLAIVLKMSKIKLKYVFKAVFMGITNKKIILSVHCSVCVVNHKFFVALKYNFWGQNRHRLIYEDFGTKYGSFQFSSQAAIGADIFESK